MKSKTVKLIFTALAFCLIISILAMGAFASGKTPEEQPTDTDSSSGSTTYTITCSSTVNGSISANKSTAKEGDSVVVTVTPADGYGVKSVYYTANGTQTTIPRSYGSEQYSFIMPAAEVVIGANFEKTYNLTLKVSPANSGTVTASDLVPFVNETVWLTVRSNDGYVIDSVKAQTESGNTRNIDVDSGDTFDMPTFHMPADNVTVTAYFKSVALHKITVLNTDEHGAVYANPNSDVSEGTTVTVTAWPKDGYVLDTLTVKDASNNNVSVSGTGNTRTFRMPDSDVTVSGTFKSSDDSEFTITCDPVSHGTVNWTPKQDSYEYNDWVRVTVEPKRGYYLQSLKINGTEVKTNGTYYDFQIREDVNITATFTNRLGVTVNYNGSGLYGTVNIFDYNWSSASYFKYNDSVWIECKPKDGYAVDEVTVTDDVTGLTISTSKSSFYDDCYSFTMPSHPVTVNVKFVVGEHKIEIAETKNGKVTVSQENASEDDRIIVSVEPDKNYKLTLLTIKTADGVKVTYTESAIKENTYYFDMPDADVTISAVFGYALDYMPFTDVKSYDWFYDAVQFVYGSGIMNGVSETSFSPDSDITRGMVVTMLWRLAGEPYVGGSYFNDVPSGEYYSVAVAWSAKYGIVDGVTETTFGVNASITREQLAAILYRYAKWMGYSTLGSSLSGYSDVNSISSWAKDAMGWAVRNGIISGVTTTRLNPTGTATRAQVAQMFLNFYEFLN